jgi:methyltransferase-like protein/ubiquinone/menaquinone biosynthesis C-methylase UbiE
MDEAIDQLRADYDTSPYESHAFPQSAPGHLAAVAYLFGLDAPDVSTARVLEIGCSAGGNLIPFAAWHPQARAVGIDLSPVQIEQGRERMKALGLTNVELLQGDIAQIDPATLGTFDFIVCHGVYSWVPDNVQQAILAAFHNLLAPDGVGYISYNTYPGWKAKEIIRDAMLLRGGAMTTPSEKVSYARGMIDFLEEVAPADSVLARALGDYKAQGDSKDYYLLHEELETFNSPCYLLEMVAQTQPHGLIYLADAAPQTMFAVNYGDKVAEPLLKECGHSQVLLEQYLDFVVNRTFRQSLLVHAERASQIRYALDRARYERMHFAAYIPPVDDEVLLDNSTQEFGAPGQTMSTGVPDVKVAMDVLTNRWPWTLSRRELVTAVQARLSAAGVESAANQETAIDDLLEYLIVRGQARYRLDPVVPEPTSTPPRLDEPARRLAEIVRTDAEPYVYNTWHESVPLSATDRHLLPLLDGSHNREALISTLLEANRAGFVQFERDGQPLSAEADIRGAAEDHVDTLAQRLTEMKLWREVESRHSRFR